MRKCSKCKKVKKLTEFYVNKTKPLGREYWCADCSREYDRSRDGTNDRVKQRSDSALRSKKKYPWKVIARRETNKLINSKKIIKKPCEVCGDIRSETHHSDYKDYINVNFLCRKHHTELHRQGKTIEEMQSRWLQNKEIDY